MSFSEIKKFAEKLQKYLSMNFEYTIKGKRNMIKDGRLIIAKSDDIEDIKRSMTHLALHKYGLKHNQDGENIGFYRDIDMDTLSLDVMDAVENIDSEKSSSLRYLFSRMVI